MEPVIMKTKVKRKAPVRPRRISLPNEADLPPLEHFNPREPLPELRNDNNAVHAAPVAVAHVPAIDDWVATSTVTKVGPFFEFKRSPELMQLDQAVATLAGARRNGTPRTTLDAATAVERQLRAWRGANADRRSIRSAAVTQLETALDAVYAGFWAPRTTAMAHVASEPNLPPGTVWLHGTDAIAEIMSSGKVWGGTAALKVLGREDKTRAAVVQADQDQHFFMARSGESGVIEVGNGGNAYIKARQGADEKLRAGTPLDSWESAGRPLLGVIEFAYNPDDDEHKPNGIRIVDTQLDSTGRFTHPLAALHPVAIRVASEADAVRVLTFVRANKGIGNLPLRIRVLANPAAQPDKALLTGDPARTQEAAATLGDGTNYQRLLKQPPDGWKTYRTVGVLDALE